MKYDKAYILAKTFSLDLGLADAMRSELRKAGVVAKLDAPKLYDIGGLGIRAIHVHVDRVVKKGLQR